MRFSLKTIQTLKIIIENYAQERHFCSRESYKNAAQVHTARSEVSTNLMRTLFGSMKRKKVLDARSESANTHKTGSTTSTIF